LFSTVEKDKKDIQTNFRKSIEIEEKLRESIARNWLGKTLAKNNTLPPIVYSYNKKFKLKAKYHSLGKMSNVVIDCDNCLENFINLKEYAMGISDIGTKSNYEKEKLRIHKKEVNGRKVILHSQYEKPEEVKEKVKIKRVLEGKDLRYRNNMKEKFKIVCFQDQDAEILKKKVR